MNNIIRAGAKTPVLINKLENVMKRVFTVCLLSCFFSPALRAVGIPIPDTTTPIKVSVSKNYKCDDKGNAFSKQDNGDYNLMKGITCHNDNLWRDGKAMNFIDMINYVADEYYNARLEKEHLLSSKPENIED
ncbi:hypothetical protein K5H10_000789 [Escherichia coli]|nr:hypothetical protein [Escherichia coli]